MTGKARPRDRILLLVDPRWMAGELLATAFLRAARGRLEVAAVCDAGRTSPPIPFRRTARRVAGELARRIFEGQPVVPLGKIPRPIEAVCRDDGMLFVVPPGRDINAPGFRDIVAGDLRANLLLSVGCPQVLGRPLLDRFEMAVNYHPGQLPAYRGLRTTAWSVYRGERETGYSFHRIDEGIDRGEVLLEGGLPVPGGVPGPVLEWRKAVAAAARMPEVVAIMARREPGRAQAGPSHTFRADETRRIVRIEEPGAHTAAELERRLLAFGRLDVVAAGRRWPATRFRPSPGGPRSFVTADGQRLEPNRFLHLPPTLYRLAERAGAV